MHIGRLVVRGDRYRQRVPLLVGLLLGRLGDRRLRTLTAGPLSGVHLVGRPPPVEDPAEGIPDDPEWSPVRPAARDRRSVHLAFGDPRGGWRTHLTSVPVPVKRCRFALVPRRRRPTGNGDAGCYRPVAAAGSGAAFPALRAPPSHLPFVPTT